MSLPANKFYRFGDFVVDTEQKVLLCNGRPVPLTPKLVEAQARRQQRKTSATGATQTRKPKDPSPRRHSIVRRWVEDN